MQAHLTLKSANVKTGPIPVSTTEPESCPNDCKLKKECYAASGPLALHWRAVGAGTRGTDWSTFTDQVAQLPAGQLWRHNRRRQAWPASRGQCWPARFYLFAPPRRRVD